MPDAMQMLSYGLFILTVHADERDNGCITNTVQQVTGMPNRISAAISKMNLTHDMVLKSGILTASILSEASDFSLFQRFGFQSGYHVEKFDGFSAVRRTEYGTLAVTEGTNAFLTGRVFRVVDLGTHTVFYADVVDTGMLSDIPSATYTYYHKHIKPADSKVGVTPAGKTIWRCAICGYEYVGESLPDDFICPLCKHPASDFVKIG